MAEQFSDLEAILKGVLGSLSEPTLWGWNARPNGAFLVITEEDAEKVMTSLEHFFENKWNEQTLANADKEVLEVVNYLSGIRERQYLFTKRVAMLIATVGDNQLPIFDPPGRAQEQQQQELDGKLTPAALAGPSWRG